MTTLFRFATWGIMVGWNAFSIYLLYNWWIAPYFKFQLIQYPIWAALLVVIYLVGNMWTEEGTNLKEFRENVIKTMRITFVVCISMIIKLF